MVAREIALIAYLEVIEWIDDSGQDYHAEFKKREAGLFCNGAENALYILPISKAKQISTPPGRKALKKAYKTFTGYDTDRALEITIPNNRTELNKIGYLTRIIYLSDKWQGGTITRYGHDYKTEVVLYSDRKSLQAARIFGAMSQTGKRLVSKRGLIA